MRVPFGIVVLVLLVLGTVGPASAAQSQDDVERRLKALEDANRLLLEQCQSLLKKNDEVQRVAEARYRELELRHEELRQQIEKRSDRSETPEQSVMLPGSERVRGGSSTSGPVELHPEETESTPETSRFLDRYPLKASLHDGFELSTLDDEVSLRFHALSQVDFKDFLPNTQFPARSGLYIPRVRVYFEGDLTRLFDYEVSLQRSVEGVWDLLDGNLDFKPSEAFQIRFGRTLVPYSYDWYDHLEQYFITPERGLFPLNFGLSRAAGILAQGWLFDRRVQYAAGGFDGRLTGVADNNNTRDAVAYLNVRPFLQSEESLFQYLNVGGSVFVGSQIAPQDPLPMRTSLQSSENDEAAENASAVFLRFREGVSALGNRAAGALHASWYYRGFSFESEFQVGRFQFASEGKTQKIGVPVTGYHIGGSYFLTGEQVTGRTTVIPVRPFDLRPGRRGPGAIEAFARFSHIELGEQVFTNDLSDPNDWTRRVAMTDVGFNWYPNRFVKFYVDWQLPVYGSPVITDPYTNRYTRTGNMFWVRCQVYF